MPSSTDRRRRRHELDGPSSDELVVTELNSGD